MSARAEVRVARTSLATVRVGSVSCRVENQELAGLGGLGPPDTRNLLHPVTTPDTQATDHTRD